MLVDRFRYNQKEEEVLPMRQTGIGRTFEHAMSAVPDEELPPQFQPNPRNWYAILSSNERSDSTFTNDDKHNPVDGYIAGVGFGNVFSMLDLLPTSRSLPKAIISTDVMPEVVLAGRVSTKKLAETSGKEEFLKAIPSTTTAEVDSVIESEKNPEIAYRLAQARGYVEMLFQSGRFPIGQGYFLNERMHHILDANFARMQQLAKEGNIGVSLMSITSPHFLTGIRDLPDFSSSRNVVYVSNIIDHMTKRGKDAGQFDVLTPLETLETFRKTVCVDTTEQDLAYLLRLRTLPPVYSGNDFPWLYRYRTPLTDEIRRSI